jgi:hypothetical protein
MPPAVVTLNPCPLLDVPAGPTLDDLLDAWIVNAGRYRECAARVECARTALTGEGACAMGMAEP